MGFVTLSVYPVRIGAGDNEKNVYFAIRFSCRKSVSRVAGYVWATGMEYSSDRSFDVFIFFFTRHIRRPAYTCGGIMFSARVQLTGSRARALTWTVPLSARISALKPANDESPDRGSSAAAAAAK